MSTKDEFAPIMPWDSYRNFIIEIPEGEQPIAIEYYYASKINGDPESDPKISDLWLSETFQPKTEKTTLAKPAKPAVPNRTRKKKAF